MTNKYKSTTIFKIHKLAKGTLYSRINSNNMPLELQKKIKKMCGILLQSQVSIYFKNIFLTNPLSKTKTYFLLTLLARRSQYIGD